MLSIDFYVIHDVYILPAHQATSMCAARPPFCRSKVHQHDNEHENLRPIVLKGQLSGIS